MPQILIADDDSVFRASTRSLLEVAGFRVREASDGNQAFAALLREPVDIVLTDILMPERDGLETISAIRQTWPDVEIIAVSGGGYCQAELLTDMALKLGASKCLIKPFSWNELAIALGVAAEGRFLAERTVLMPSITEGTEL